MNQSSRLTRDADLDRDIAMMDQWLELAGADWAGYYAWSSGREPRPLLLTACERMGAGAGRVAVDIGCGDGTDALALLARGWSVMAIDREPAGLDLLRVRLPAGSAGRIQIVSASFINAGLPPADLIHAGFSLPFCAPTRFPGVWARIRAALLPGAIFAGQLFGRRDSCADDPGMVFHDLPKHWHVYDILAQEPAHEHLSPGHCHSGCAGGHCH